MHPPTTPSFISSTVMRKRQIKEDGMKVLSLRRQLGNKATQIDMQNIVLASAKLKEEICGARVPSSGGRKEISQHSVRVHVERRCADKTIAHKLESTVEED